MRAARSTRASPRACLRRSRTTAPWSDLSPTRSRARAGSRGRSRRHCFSCMAPMMGASCHPPTATTGCSWSACSRSCPAPATSFTSNSPPPWPSAWRPGWRSIAEMATRRPEGAALLVAGYGTPDSPALDASALHTLGQIGEALLATGAPWQIRRLAPTAGERYVADRATLKRHLDDLAIDPVRAAVVALVGTIVDVGGAPALVTGAQALEYPEDATLPLAWIQERLAAVKAEHLVAIVSARGDGTPQQWLGALGTQRAHHVIAVDAPAEGNPLIDALLTGLCGDALDRRTGTVTIASLSDHVARSVPAAVVQGSTVSETLAQPPPLAGLWDVRQSQLANRIARTRSP